MKQKRFFLQTLFLCFILFSLFAGVIIVSNKEAVLKKSSASDSKSICAKNGKSCVSLGCCPNALVCSTDNICICNIKKCKFGCFEREDTNLTKCFDCKTNSDCPSNSGKYCKNGMCTDSCSKISDCPDGYVCENNVCKYKCRIRGSSCTFGVSCCPGLKCVGAKFFSDGTCQLSVIVTPTPTPKLTIAPTSKPTSTPKPTAKPTPTPCVSTATHHCPV